MTAIAPVPAEADANLLVVIIGIVLQPNGTLTGTSAIARETPASYQCSEP